MPRTPIGTRPRHQWNSRKRSILNAGKIIGKYLTPPVMLHLRKRPDQAENGELQPYIDIQFPVSIEYKNFYSLGGDGFFSALQPLFEQIKHYKLLATLSQFLYSVFRRTTSSPNLYG